MRGGCVVALFVAGCGRFAFDPMSTATTDATDGTTTSDDGSQLNCTTETFAAMPVGWTMWSDTAGFDAFTAGGQFTVQLQPNANGYAGGYLQFLDLTDGSISVEAVQVPASTKVESYIEFGPDNSNLFTLNYSEGTLGFFRLVNGTRDVMNTAPYNAGTDRWWRLEHHAATGMLAYATSSDGTTWQERLTVAAAFPVSSVLIEMAAGTYAGGSANPGTPLFDNFTYCVK